MLKSSKKALSVLGQILVITAISLIFTEVAFRIYNKINPSFVFYENSYNRFRGRPFADDYQFKLNSKGFKDVEFQTQKAEGTFRILGIGDSFAYGVIPYEHNYYTVLEENLKAEGKKVELINMGIPNLNPKDYLSIFVNEGLELNPDMVILSFFIGNDFINSQESRSLYSYSYVASFLRYVIGLTTKYKGNIIHGSYVYQDNNPSMETPAYLELEKIRSYIYRPDNLAFPQDFAYTMTYMQKIKEICDSRNIKLVVAIIPDELQVNPKLRDKVYKVTNTRAEEYDFRIPNRQLAEAFKTMNIDYLDLLDEMETSTVQKKTRVYKVNDSHWNIAGNKLAAELIQKHLDEQQLIPEK